MINNKISIAIDSTMMDGRTAKGTALVIRKLVNGLVGYKNEFEITLIHKFKQPNEKIYSEYNEIIIPRIWNFLYGGVINELIFFLTLRIKNFLGMKPKFDIYFVAYSRLLPSFIFAPAKKFIFYPMDGGPKTANYDLAKAKTPFPSYVTFFKSKIDRFLVLTKFGQDGIVKEVDVPREKVPIVTCGVDNVYVPFEKNPELTQRAMSLGVPDRYILCVSRFDPHKNILGMLHGYNFYKQDRIKNGKRYYPLLFVGGKHMPDYNMVVEDEIKKLDLVNDVAVSERIFTEAEFNIVYSNAEFLVFPSFYEGFGLPAIEAMRSGTVVLCSNNSSLEEVGGDAALKFDPYNFDEIGKKMVQISDDEVLSKSLREKGLEWSKQFTWDNSVKQLVEVLRNINK